MADNFQRTGATSNAQVGRDFERAAARVLADEGITVTSDYALDIGVGKIKKAHKFDFGADNPAVIVECKSHRWTSGGNMPSAKITVWNEAMYYFKCAPSRFRKIFFVLRDVREKTGESLAEYYLKTHHHLIPTDVEVWEFDESTSMAKVVYSVSGDESVSQ